MKGFGTVVTGTLVAGELRSGEELEILPSGRRARVRGLQVHGESVERALAGTRTAVNLAGVEVEDVARGHVLVRPGTLRPTSMLDVELSLLARRASAAGRRPRARPRGERRGARARGAARCEVTRAGDDVGRPAAARDACRRGARRPSGAAFLLARGDDRRRERPRPAAAATHGGGSRRRRAAARRRAGRRGRDARGRSGASGLSAPLLAARLAVPCAGAARRSCVSVPDWPCSGRSRPSSSRAARSVCWGSGRSTPSRRSTASIRFGRGCPGRSCASASSPAPLPVVFEQVLGELGARDGRARCRTSSRSLATRCGSPRGRSRRARCSSKGPDRRACRASRSRASPATAAARPQAPRARRPRARDGAGAGSGRRRPARAPRAARGAEAEVRRRWAAGSKLDVAAFKELTGLSRKYVIPLLEYLDRERLTRRSGSDRVVL